MHISAPLRPQSATRDVQCPFVRQHYSQIDMQVSYDDACGEVIVLDDDEDGADRPGPSNRRRSSVGGSKGLLSNRREPTGHSTSDNAHEVVDLTSSDDEGGLFVAPLNFPHRKDRQPGRGRPPQPSGKREWACSACTYLNAPWADACSMCLTKRI